MSLICHEKGMDIIFGEPLAAAKRPDRDSFNALSAEVVDAIPAAERLASPRQLGENGVNIHRAISGRNWNNSYTVIDFTLCEFIFSISEETAAKYLPKFVTQFPAAA